MPAGASPGRPSATPLRFERWAELCRDLRRDYHMHTSFTDGRAGVEEMAAAAERAGLHEILFSEHIRHTSTYYPAFLARVRAVTPARVRTFAGVEAKILDLDGTLDCPPDVMAQCDAVVGSVHGFPPALAEGKARWQELELAAAVRLEFELAMAIVKGSRAHILGHPMGIAIRFFDARPMAEIEALARACAECGKAFELNPRYCPDPRAWTTVVQAAGCPVSLGSDAHGPEAVGTAWSVFVEGP